MNFPRIRSTYLPLAAASFLVLAYNVTFWRKFASAVGGFELAKLPVYIGSCLLLVMVFSGVLALVNYRRLFKPVLIALLLLSSVTAYFMSQYGIVIDASMVQNVLETDTREAGELFSWKLVQAVLLLGVVPSWLVWRLPVQYAPLRRSIAANGGVLAVSLLAAIGLLFLLFKPLAPAVREHRELRFMLTPTNVFQAANAYLKLKLATPTIVAPLGTDASKGRFWSAGGDAPRTVTVIVVGETARAMNFSLNGYARDTNPRLAREPALVNFSNVSSCGTATAVSVPCVFSDLTRNGYSEDKARSKEGLLDVLRHAGLEVVWRDNNSGCKGVCQRVRFEDVSKAVAGNPLCDGEECYDERLLEGLPELIRSSSKDLVIVLHQKGSHGPAYWKRYPAGFGKFGPVCQTNELEQCSREEITAAYDNSILYTDYFLSRTIEVLKEAGVAASMLYFSDHGESLGEKNMYLHGAPYIFSPEEQRKVPMMLWMSDSFSQRFHVNRGCLAARSSQPFSHDNVFHSTLGMLNISTAVYNPKLDLFQACTHDS
ncbi:phosphoethanolamine transferase [Pseudoduganella sp.]|uniref:phosphoethanolamine transferase n=1 Tax=Pseudoduganella sp. TaxID=1880898 RepID=UPI0035B313C6